MRTHTTTASQNPLPQHRLPQSPLPMIRLTKDDHDRLWRLADAAMRSTPQVASFLAEELERAEVVPTHAALEAFVRIGSRVQFRDEKTGTVRDVTLVMPADENIDENKISVMTPIGAALLGLSAGQRMRWTTPTGETRELTVQRVR